MTLKRNYICNTYKLEISQIVDQVNDYSKLPLNRSQSNFTSFISGKEWRKGNIKNEDM
jgi:hypothetical protein